jgi:hypothetical protein
MNASRDHVYKGRDQTAPPLTDAPVADDPLDIPREMEASCEAIER